MKHLIKITENTVEKLKVVEKGSKNKDIIVGISTNKAEIILTSTLGHKQLIKSIVKLGNRCSRAKVILLYMLKAKYVIDFRVCVKSFRGFRSHWRP